MQPKSNIYRYRRQGNLRALAPYVDVYEMYGACISIIRICSMVLIYYLVMLIYDVIIITFFMRLIVDSCIFVV